MTKGSFLLASALGRSVRASLHMFAALLVCALPLCSLCDEMMALWWQVGDPSDWGTGADSLASIDVLKVDGTHATARELGVNAARIKVVETGDYLPMLIIDDTGAATSVNAPMPVPIAAFADISGYSGTSAEYSFVVELGNWTDSQWVFAANSESITYDRLEGSIARWSDSYAPNPVSPWTPVSYSVPEPCSGLLLLLGASALALRRRSPTCCA